MTRITETPLSLSRARSLLNLDDQLSTPSQTQIQRNFVRVAKLYHPDSRHNEKANPCAETFRECHEARRILLEHYCGQRPKFLNTSNSYRAYEAPPGFRSGFPYRTLRILTVKQNLSIRAAVFLALATGSLYDGWRQKQKRAQKQENDVEYNTQHSTIKKKIYNES